MYKKLLFISLLMVNANQLQAACANPIPYWDINQPNLLEWAENNLVGRREFVNKTGQTPDSYPKSGVNLDDLKEKLDIFNEHATEDLENFEEPYVQKKYIPSGSQVCFMGDIHGSLHSLLRNLLRLHALGYINKNFKIIKPNFYMVFLGDYIDRGRYGLEVIDTLLSLKLANWENVSLLRGNHETEWLCTLCGFDREIAYKLNQWLCTLYGYDREFASKLNFCKTGDFNAYWQQILKFFSNLPLAVYIGSGKDNSWIQCCHGGIEPTFNPKALLNNKEISYLDISDIINSDRPIHGSIAKSDVKNFRANSDPYRLELYRCGLNTCDFESSAPGDAPFFTHELGRGYKCSVNMAKELLAKCGLKAIFRGHQHFYFGLKLDGENHWKDLCPNQKTISLSNFTIFTFSTAAEGVALPYDCFGILKTADRYEDWTLTPYEFELPKNRNEKFVHTKGLRKGQLPTFEWNFQGNWYK